MTTRRRRFIAWWQIVCGVLGLALFGAMYMDWLPGGRSLLENTLGWINYYAGLGFFSLCIAAGRSLLRGERWGFAASALCQTVQVLSFAILNGPLVQIAAGPKLELAIASSGSWDFSLGFNSAFFLGHGVSGPDFTIAINIIALAWAFMLWTEIHRTRRDPDHAPASPPASLAQPTDTGSLP